jgi:hypothetical protein
LNGDHGIKVWILDLDLDPGTISKFCITIEIVLQGKETLLSFIGSSITLSERSSGCVLDSETAIPSLLHGRCRILIKEACQNSMYVKDA